MATAALGEQKCLQLVQINGHLDVVVAESHPHLVLWALKDCVKAGVKVPRVITYFANSLRPFTF